jgi:hypothetical protein
VVKVSTKKRTVPEESIITQLEGVLFYCKEQKLSKEDTGFIFLEQAEGLERFATVAYNMSPETYRSLVKEVQQEIR